MEPFALYDKISNSYDNDKEFLEKKLEIETNISLSDIDIDSIYYHCEKQLEGFSITSFCERFNLLPPHSSIPRGRYKKTHEYPMYSLGDIDKSSPEYKMLENTEPISLYRLDKYGDLSIECKFSPISSYMDKCVMDYYYRLNLSILESINQPYPTYTNASYVMDNIIKNHCIIKAFYSFEYLRNSGKFITTNALFDRYNSNNSDVSGENPKRRFNERAKSFNESKEKELQKQLMTYKEEENKKGKTRYVLNFLELFTYHLIENQGNDKNKHFQIDTVVNTLCTLKEDSPSIRKYAQKIVDGISTLDDHFDFSNNTNSEKILLNYKKELSFHHDLLWYFYNTQTIEDFYISDYLRLTDITYDNITLEDLSLSFKLPNAYSRNVIFDFVFNSASPDDFWSQTDILRYFLQVLFPIYERTFFILLYESIKKLSPEKVIEKASTLLKSYVEENYFELTKDYLYIPNILSELSDYPSEFVPSPDCIPNKYPKILDLDSYQRNDFAKVIPDIFKNNSLHDTYNYPLYYSFEVNEEPINEIIKRCQLFKFSEHELRRKKQVEIAIQYSSHINYELNYNS